MVFVLRVNHSLYINSSASGQLVTIFFCIVNATMNIFYASPYTHSCFLIRNTNSRQLCLINVNWKSLVDCCSSIYSQHMLLPWIFITLRRKCHNKWCLIPNKLRGKKSIVVTRDSSTLQSIDGTHKQKFCY